MGRAALAAAFLATVVSYAVPEPLLLSARADEAVAASAFGKQQAAVERRKEIMLKACVSSIILSTHLERIRYGPLLL